MNVEQFAAQIRKENSNIRRKEIIAYLVLVAFGIFFSEVSTSSDILFFIIGECIVVVNALEIARYEWNQYVYYCEVDEAIAFKHPLSEVMRMQAFPVKKYFAYVTKKMYALAILLGATNLFIGIGTAIRIEGSHFGWSQFGIALGFSAVCTVSPWIVGRVKHWIWNEQRKRGTTGMLSMIGKLVNLLFGIVKYLFAIVVTVLGTLLFYGKTIEFMMPLMDETRAVLRSYYFIYGMILILLVEVAGFFWFLYWDAKKRVSNILGIVVGCGLLVSVGVTFVIANFYTEVSKQGIVVHSPLKEEVYALSEVKQFEIYEADDSIQMKFFFEDGNTTKINGGSMESNKLYDQTYPSEYHFITDYILWLQEAGATGTLNDVEKLQKDVAELNPEIAAGLAKIIEEMK
jgi:hypothetical protein